MPLFQIFTFYWVSVNTTYLAFFFFFNDLLNRLMTVRRLVYKHIKFVLARESEAEKKERNVKSIFTFYKVMKEGNKLLSREKP